MNLRQPSTKILFLLLALGFLVRLINLDAPLIGTHSWRQSDTAAMARSFYEEGMRFGSPRVDWRGAGSGEVESELPLFPYTVAVLYQVLGQHQMLGRLLSVICFMVGAYFVFQLAGAIFDQVHALWTLGIYLFLPQTLFYSRSFQPEGMLLLFIPLALYLFLRWTRSGYRWHLFASGLAMAAAIGIKLPAIYMGLPLAYLAYLRFGPRWAFKPVLWLYAAVCLLPPACWYWHAHQLFLETGLTFEFWPSGNHARHGLDMVFSLGYWNRVIFQQIAEHHLLWPGFLLLLAGMAQPRTKRLHWVLEYWLAAFAVFLCLAPERNYVHEYYQLPLMIPLSMYMAKTCAKYVSFKHKTGLKTLAPCLLALLCLAGAAAGGSDRYYNHLRLEDYRNYRPRRLVQQVKKHTKSDDLIMFAPSFDPTPLYQSGRKGWTFSEHELNQDYFERAICDGAAYLAAMPAMFRGRGSALKSYFLSRGELVAEGPDYFLLKIDPSKAACN